MSLLALRSRGQRLLLAVLLPMLLVAGSLGVALPAAPALAGNPPPGPHPHGKIAPELLDSMPARAGADKRIEAVVTLEPRTDAVPETAKPGKAREALADAAESAQEPVVQLVESRGDQVVNTFWLKNMVLVRVKPATLNELAELPMVNRVIPNFKLSAPATPPRAAATPEGETGGSAWGITKIGADRVWKEHGLTGKGVRVAVLDTGIDIGHPDLAGKLVSDKPSDPAYPGGWIEFGADGKPVASTPHDSYWHGTHVAGTIAGGDASGTRIGVAPGVELMAGLVLPGGEGTLAQVIAGMQWAIAPYGADGKPAGKPADVVSMSLGGEGYDDEMIEPTRNIYRAGAFPAFAIGNDCAPNGSGSPGNVYEAVAVGATDVNDDVPDFSCGGVVRREDWFHAPAEWPDTYTVPDVSAPGAEVMSAVPGGGYGIADGTSMATPHVSGTVALILEARPGLTVDQTLEVLEGTAFFDRRYGERPNPRYGSGRIDAYAAVAEVSADSGVQGTVTDGRTRKPLAGVTITNTATGRAYHTDAQGRFQIRLLAGAYDFTLSRFGYQDATTHVTVAVDRFTQADVALQQTPRGRISGQVVYGPTGISVPGATVRVLSVPDRLAATTDGNGRYTIGDVPEGDYRVVASAAAISAAAPRPVTVSGGRGGQADFALPRMPDTKRASVTGDGIEGDDDVWWASLNGDGSLMVLGTGADNLVPDDTNGSMDVFVRDMRSGDVRRVSVASDGTQADSDSLVPHISADGRYVGYSSTAANLAPGDTNGMVDSYVHDLRTGKTERVSVASDGTQGNDKSFDPLLSGDGRYAVFSSYATNLVPGDTNDRGDIFVHDRQTGKTERVSVASDGTQGSTDAFDPSVSADGRFVAFDSRSPELAPGDTDEHNDVFVRDLRNGTTERVPAPDGLEASSPALSADGRVVAYLTSGGPMGFQIFAYDRQTRATTLVSAGGPPNGGVGDSDSFAPAVSADGRLVAFYSYAANLVPGDGNGREDVFVRDLTAGTTERVSTGPQGEDGDGRSTVPALSGNGRYVAFLSDSGNLVEGDRNGRFDAFVHDLAPGPEARFALADLRVNPSEVRPGRPAEVTASAKNVGEKGGEYYAVLSVNGRVEARQTVQAQPGRTVRISFEVRRQDPGAYTVRLGPLQGEFTVKTR
ncbi:S8 family serine peptidase [Microbispora sp. NEAU-D428]|uniref:S8 family serine peptidase n=1 Tax=Microbispora sitophila TaxID=2771537 RepID=UPI0018690F49|nr:S8 family serine peptidase [Microbispora sitophila]MBE3009936.1 S8 family serine peptidase [Microbispora sitophila]